MSSRFSIACGQTAHPRRSSDWQKVVLDLSPSSGNVQLRTRDITNRLVSNIDPVWSDLIEIATYVYVADQAARRNNSAESVGANWKRQFAFSIPVRCPDVWRDTSVGAALTDLLNYISGDIYSLRFEPKKHTQPLQLKLLTEHELGHQDIDEIALFSGGLDSLAGAVRMGSRDRKKMLLVSHRSSGKISKRQRYLAERLVQRFGSQQFFHVPVWINKDSKLSDDFTQRTRSFLFASLAGAMAVLLGRFRIHFFENGITSVNLPIASQLVSTRASRSTHPKTLSAISSLFSLLAGKTFAVANDLFWYTKAQVIDIVGDEGCADLIPHTVSCHHTWDMTRYKTHCGRCSQCIGRRFAALASRYAQHDPAEMYKLQLLTDERDSGPDLTLLESTIRFYDSMRKLETHEFARMNGEVLSAVGHLKGNRVRNLERLVRLHRDHANDLNRVITDGIAQHAEQIRSHSLPKNCLLSMTLNEPPGEPMDVEQFPSLPGLSATDDFRTLWVNGTEFTFSATQAACVQHMVEQSRKGPASLSQAAILESADSRCKTLKSLFKRSPAWRTLIIPGKQKGTYRLNIKS